MSTDGQPYMLQPGEFIVNKDAYEENRGLVEAINGGADLSLYAAKGGPIYAAAGGVGLAIF